MESTLTSPTTPASPPWRSPSSSTVITPDSSAASA